MDIHVDIRGFLGIHAWICYGFSDQGTVFSIRTPMLKQGRLEHTETNIMHFKWVVT